LVECVEHVRHVGEVDMLGIFEYSLCLVHSRTGHRILNDIGGMSRIYDNPRFVVLKTVTGLPVRFISVLILPRLAWLNRRFPSHGEWPREPR
jgi:hypothetical protein